MMKNNGGYDTAAVDIDGTDTAAFEPIAKTMNDLRALMVDVAEDQACSRLGQRIIALTSTGTSADDTRNPVTGSLWIRQCSSEQIEGDKLEINLAGKGWRWLARTRETFGAQFEIDEYFRFEAEISMTGTFDAAYDMKQNILTLWFVPTQPVEVDFIVQNSIGVKEETIWGDIVGTVGSLFGQAPGERAQQAISERGARRIRSKLDHGFTVILDLCTGNQFTRFGTFPAGKVPGTDREYDDVKMLSRRRAYLRKGGLVVAGPYTAKGLTAYYDILEGPGAHLSVVCMEDAEKIMDAFISNKPIPDVSVLAEKSIQGRESGSLSPKTTPQCEVAFIMQPLQGQESATMLNYAVANLAAESKAIIQCE